MFSGGHVQAEEPGELLRQTADERQVIAEAIEREVIAEVAAARDVLERDPAAAIDRLKLLGETVDAAADLTAENTAAFRNEIETVLRTAAARLLEHDLKEQDRAASLAAKEDRQRMLARFHRDGEKLAQLMARFDALLDERRYELAESVVAEVGSLAGHKPVGASAPLMARTQRYHEEAATTRIERQRGVVATLHQAELALMPRSDEPPIVYIDPAEWQELTVRRRGLPIDMHREKPAHVRIRQALEESTELEFVETALGDAIAFLKDRHGIEIQLDLRALEAAGLASDTPVTANLRGITLRSALRLLLRQLDLTYAVQDEVLLITTPETAATMLESRVHRVADIVLPIQNLSGFGQLGSGQNNRLFGVNPGQNQQNQNQNGGNPFNNNNQNNLDPFNFNNQNGQNLF
jgi:hypothetical protein